MAKDLLAVDHIIFICNGGSCLKKGAEENTNLLREAIKENGIHETIHTIKTRCCGQCEHGPVVFVQPDNIWYKEIDAAASREIVTSHLIHKQKLSSRILYRERSKKHSLYKTLLKNLFRKKIFKISVCLALMQLSVAFTYSQPGVTGVVKDEYTQEPLEGVMVVVEETKAGTYTDKEGVFGLPQLKEGSYTLNFSFTGYASVQKKVRLSSGTEEKITLYLKPHVLDLAEVVINSSTTRQGENKMDALSLQLQPVNSAQDLLRTVPGLFIAQHAGGGKAEQIFVRGNDNDHGTDFAVFYDGLPVNMPTHAHGQGYADMHFIIPETVGKASFYKGPYDARLGDFSISGASLFSSKYRLDNNILKTEFGMYNSQRYLGMVNVLGKKHLVKQWEDNAYVASDYTYNKGFFQNPLDFGRFNLFGRYNASLSRNSEMMFTFSTFSSKWNASGQLPRRAIDAGEISRYGSMDNSEGGQTSRTNLNLKITRYYSPSSSFSSQFYYSKNLFTLFSNFTFFMNDSIQGDEIKQWENRDLFGYKGIYKRNDSIGSTSLQSEVGLITRTDILSRGRDHVERRAYLSTDALNNASITNYSFYIDENWSFQPKWNLNFGLRNELFSFNLKDKLDVVNSGSKWVCRLNPKLNLYYDLSSKLTLYAKSGVGFHSNFVQAVLSKDASANPVPQSYGADLGSNFKAGKRLVVSIAGWWLHVGAEYKFVSDDGSFEEIGNSRKAGVDVSMRYQPFSFLWADVHFNYAKGILLGAPKGENLLPLHPNLTSTGAVTWKLNNGWNGSLRYRYMGTRPATEDGSVKARSYLILDAVVKYTKPKYEVGISIENIFNRKWDEAQFYDASQLKNETAPVTDFHITPGTPFNLKGMISYFF